VTNRSKILGCLGWTGVEGGTIVVGSNDGSVQLQHLLPDGTLDVKRPEARGVKAWADYLTKQKQPLPEFAPVEQRLCGQLCCVCPSLRQDCFHLQG